MTQNRKRSRNFQDDDTSDFMPLSKRINNLHINNAFQTVSNIISESLVVKPSDLISTATSEKQVYHNVNNYESNVNNTEWNNVVPQYNPELSSSENPYYYNNNKVLFDLFVERMRRNGHNFN